MAKSEATIEERLAAIEQQQVILKTAMEQFTAVFKEHLESTGNDPYRIATVEQVAQGLVQATEQIGNVVQAMLQGRRVL